MAINNRTYRAAQNKFDYYRAQDEIDRWLQGNFHTMVYVNDVAEKLEKAIEAAGGEWSEEADKLADEAAGIADALTDAVRGATGGMFDGQRYNALVAAARARLGINW